ncbi:MAG: nicotinate-nucleotide--dimethylbenzimidazole phosphoribosyltransferase [Lachnospiraceae bacterium]|nr:nicotinate-nucleotide--dimethylbenzimidazole phosphoribosyltransferase [Lachnospiraceae bacterium]
MTIDELFSIKIDQPETKIRALSKQKWDALAKPIDGLGDFEELVCRIAAIKGTVSPGPLKKALIIMCADNGVVKEGVSQTGQQVTYDVTALMGERKSSVGILTQNYPLDILVCDVGVNCADTPGGVIDKKVCRGTADFVKEPAMSSAQCLAAISAGIELVKECRDKNIDIVATGEMGIGNTTTSTALLCAITGAAPEACTGKGSGLSEEGLEQKIRVIKEGLRLHLGERMESGALSQTEVFEAMRCLGGLDIAGLAGVYIGGAIYGIPVVVDGLISAVAALAAERIVPGCKEYMIASHMGREKGMEILVKELSLKPVIFADMALGEGTGAVMLFPILDMVLSLYQSGTSFASTSIEQYERFEQR